VALDRLAVAGPPSQVAERCGDRGQRNLLVRGCGGVDEQQQRASLAATRCSTRGGRVAWIYRSRGPEDRPTIDQIAAARAAG